ncbi:MAG: hypothetical protein AB3N21_11600 [Ruegeria sp.]|uniref:hypothetical protein n=1 Tax=Ruegeria sp. TaxID=1879320 RepID=UPI00349E58D9
MNSHKTEGLQDFPVDQLQVLLVRHALRAFPAISPDVEGDNFDEDFFLRHARTLLCACCMIAVPSKEIALATKISAFAAGDFTRGKIQTAASLIAKAASEALFLESNEEKRRAIDTAIEFLPHTLFSEQGHWDLGMIGRSASRSLVFDYPLWTIELRHFEQRQQVLLPTDRLVEKRLSFWVEWHKAFSRGKPLDWDLQRRVALIEDSVWSAGPDAVADEIEKIRARWHVERALADLKDSASVRTNARHGIGGNDPPESIQDERLSRSITLIWGAVEDLGEEVAKDTPDRERVEAILRALKSGLASVLKWCGAKADLAVDTAIKWGVPVGGAYLVANPEKVQALVEAVEGWLAFLP